MRAVRRLSWGCKPATVYMNVHMDLHVRQGMYTPHPVRASGDLELGNLNAPDKC